MSNLQPPRSSVALGGLMAALAVVFGMLSQLLPLFFGLLAPLPLALAAIWLSTGTAIVSGVAATLVIGILLGPLTGLSFLCRTVFLGLISGILVKKRQCFAVIFTGSTLALVIGTAILLLLQMGLMGIPLPSFSALENDMFATAESMNLYSMMADSGMNATQAEAYFKQVVHVMVQLAPAIYVLLFALEAGAVLLLLHLLCRRLQTEAQVPVPDWKAILMPPAVLVPFLLAWMVLLADRYIDNQVLWIVAANVMVIGAVGMALDGFSYVMARLKFSEKPLITQFLYLALVLLMGVYLIVVCAVIGVFDSIADYRQLRSQKGAKPQ